MRLVAVVLAASVFGCSSNSYEIRSSELQRLATIPPAIRGQHVRVVEQLSDSDSDPLPPVYEQTPLVVFPEDNVHGPERRDYYMDGGGTSIGGGPNGNLHGAHASGGGHGGGGHASGGGHGGGGGWGGGGGDGRAEAIAILVVAAVILFVVAGVEGSRFDGYARLHPMHPVHLFGRDGGTAVLPLAWIDPETAAWADHAIVRSDEGPWRPLERAPLDRQGLTYGMFGGVGTYRSADGSKALGTATTIQLGYFPTQQVGVVGSMFFGWRDNAVDQTLFESRYTAELQVFPVVTGPLHLGLYGGGGAAYRWEDGIAGGDAGSIALTGGAQLQLDVNTRIALTARLGTTYAHQEQMSDALFGISVY